LIVNSSDVTKRLESYSRMHYLKLKLDYVTTQSGCSFKLPRMSIGR